MRTFAIAGLLLILTGCTTADHVYKQGEAPGMAGDPNAPAVFKHPTTGDEKVCKREDMSTMNALFCLPCGFTEIGNRFAACKTRLEEAGYVRQRSEP
jgi:hypothetical protein